MIRRDYLDYVQDILDSIQDIESFVEGMTLELFSKDKKTINAVVRSLEVIGEATKNIPNAVKEKYPDIPWKKMAGMRDKMIHEYFGIDFEMLWKTVKEDIPPLRVAVRKLIKTPK